ncbi:MAG: hypothetical protein IJV08_11780 [Bacteroidaceae bacterium]|nr:hypothetical protein [Bacteroidaceae bacterium]MBQ9560633.1 hypothetical protein [Bacteroidaceae bacterium]
MNYKTIHIEDLGVTLEYAFFRPKEGAGEWHVMLHVEARRENFEGQLHRIYEAENRLTQMPDFKGARYVLKRYFLSDSTNQQPLMRQEPDVAISVIQQQPLDGSKVAVWLYLVDQFDIYSEHGAVVMEHNGYKHLWRMGMTSTEGDSARQTETLLNDYEAMLSHFGGTLADNCIRTWFFVRDVDTQYAGMVRARRENFVREGLTPQTHYIASTGIGGGPAETKALIQLGTYALKGFQPEQQQYLYAKTHLNPTYEYGVTFERGTKMTYGDRSHIFISGTASINNRGEVVHVGDIRLQTLRMWENVEALLHEGDMDFQDVMHLVVYLRDTADYEVVSEMFRDRFPDIPTIITLAPVCRPTWLIEMECIAVKNCKNEKFPCF